LKVRQRFVLVFSIALMVPFVVLTSLGVNDLGFYVSSYFFIYLAMRLVLDPKPKLGVDILGVVLFAGFAFFIAQHVFSALGIQMMAVVP